MACTAAIPLRRREEPTLQVTEVIAGGAESVMTVDKVQQSAGITDSVGRLDDLASARKRKLT